MYYISTKDAAEKFELSDSLNFLSLKEMCEILSISTATGRNWLKLGKIIANYTEKGTPYFSRKYVSALQAELQSGANNTLKSRRNKKYISGNSLYKDYVSEKCQNISTIEKLLAYISEKQIDLDTPTIQLLVADCALHLFVCKNGIQIAEHQHLLLKFLNNEFSIGEYDQLIYDLIDTNENTILFCKTYPSLFCNEYIYEATEDILGLLYISCKNIGNRKSTGAYYTPTNVVQKLICGLDFSGNGKILDPCCGTGNFLLQLPDDISFDSIYGNDTDAVSAKISRINMALKYGAPIALIHEHFTDLDYLTSYTADNFQYIIGNPPWGYAFTGNEKKQLRTIFKSASGRNVESYDIFIEQALNRLETNGHLVFVLPEALLNVRSHTKIRELILECCSIKNLIYLGNAFDGVQCPCIILDLQSTGAPLSTIGTNVHIGSKSFTINTDRKISPENFSFTTTDEEYNVLNKIKSIENAAFLLDNADFALGIVTGNNKKYISDTKTSRKEMILKGSDICKYHIKPTTNYIVYTPASFQQTAPTEMYRAPEKLLYRFICSELVFAYDDKQTLSLNSCNIVIPKIPGVKIKYVLAILNSSIAQFVFNRVFNSVKVLRSHIESIPIPVVDEARQDEIIALTNRLIDGLGKQDAERTFNELDVLISQMFNLSSSEFEIVKNAVGVESRFLV